MTRVDQLSLFETIPHKVWIERAPFLSDMKYWLGIIDRRNTLEMQRKSSFCEQLNNILNIQTVIQRANSTAVYEIFRENDYVQNSTFYNKLQYIERTVLKFDWLSVVNQLPMYADTWMNEC